MNNRIFFEDIHMNNLADDETEFIPLMSPEDEEQMNSETLPEEIAILPLRNTVLFPGVVIPITVGRDKSIRLIKDAYKGNKTIGVVAQKNDAVEDPGIEDLNKVGTVAFIIKMLRMPDGNTTVIMQGKRRFVIGEAIQTAPYLKAKITPLIELLPKKNDSEFSAIIGSVKDTASRIIRLNPHIPQEANVALKNIESTSFLINFISSNLNATVKEKQEVLEMADLKRCATQVLTLLTKEMQMLELKNQIQSKVKVDIDKQQREYFLQQQMKTIQEELGGSPMEQELKEIHERAKNKKWSKEVGDVFQKELSKLERMNPNAAEHSVQMNYLELLLDIPWNEYTQDSFDLRKAQQILDRDHFGMEKVKERILEHLAVLKLKGNMKAPILCLYGPPGVGKTSLGKSIAEALGRKYVRMSLGGLKDESEIRGHRKTYIGALPGRIMQNIKKAASANPVFVLDELDKVGNDWHGDPSSALLEVLDPEQNHTFYDNYIELDFDLSKVMFIATANSLSTIQPALRDRLEIIEVPGYTTEEKLEIARHHLIPKQLEEHGVKKSQIAFSNSILEYIIENYTRESGVRAMEKQIGKMVRYAAKNIAMENSYKNKPAIDDLQKILGPAHEKDRYQGNDVAGVVTGLAWTPVGGDILFIETSLSKGKGKFTLTGNLGEVMKESAVIALEYLRAHGELFGIDTELFDHWNVHIHVPEGATPKDGPSAGIAMLTAIASAFTQRKVKKNLAMTGEITLRGRVLAVGGIREKILAAKRAGIKEVILCEENRKDVEEIKAEYLKGLSVHYVERMIEVLQYALLKEKVKNPLDLKLPPARTSRSDGEEKESNLKSVE
ncbi:MAG: endopeptidase La [Bacteroidetes bacterium]|nr:endopeptidase La [Bacteroidota bacterium]